MADSAKVRSIEALRDFKVALKDFEETAKLALGEAQHEVQRALGWLQNDRVMHWKRELRRRQNRWSDAKSELMRAQIASATSTSAVVERKNVEKWKRAVEEAERKLQNIKKWSRQLERDMTMFKAQCQPLARTVEGEMPRAYAILDRLYAVLDKYVRMAPPGSGGSGSAPPAGAPSEGGSSADGDEGPADSGYASDS